MDQETGVRNIYRNYVVFYGGECRRERTGESGIYFRNGKNVWSSTKNIRKEEELE